MPETLMFKERHQFIRFVSKDVSPVVEKSAYILERCAGKTVLDLGCIDHSFNTALDLGDDWLHRQIKNVSTRLVGLDILGEDAAELNKRGYDIREGNAEEFDLGEKFDVIVAGDLIEHLSNIGMFLQAVKRHMHEHSIFIVSTPNPFNIEQSVSALLSDEIHVHPQHTVWLSPHVCWELVRRENLCITEFSWLATRFAFSSRRKYWGHIANGLVPWIMKRKPLTRRDFAVVLSIPAPSARCVGSR